MYEDSEGVPKDFAEAIRWYRLGANPACRGRSAWYINVEPDSDPVCGVALEEMHLLDAGDELAEPSFEIVQGEVRSMFHQAAAALFVWTNPRQCPGARIGTGSQRLRHLRRRFLITDSWPGEAEAAAVR
jgi:hypothetical protein